MSRLRPQEFDASIFERVAGSAEEDRVDEEDGREADEPAPQREGLPAGFRMRHDAHYVEELVSKSHAGRIQMIATREIDDPRPAEGRDLEPLVTSVADFGVLQPLLVRRLPNGRCELIAGSRRLAAAIAAGLQRVPCLVHAVDDARAQALANATRRSQARPAPRPRDAQPALAMAKACAEIGAGLDAVGACLHLFRGAGRPASEQVALDLIAAEVARTTWLVQALSVLDEDPPVANVAVDLGSVLRRVAAALAPRRHAAGRLDVQTGNPEPGARGDEQLLTVAIAGMVMALQAVTERHAGAVQVRGRGGSGGRVRVEATQDALRMPSSWRDRFLELEWADRPGGRRIGVALAAAQRIAELHRGSLTVEDSEQGGCRLVLSLPADGRA
jgi:hypothetical protein